MGKLATGGVKGSCQVSGLSTHLVWMVPGPEMEETQEKQSWRGRQDKKPVLNVLVSDVPGILKWKHWAFGIWCSEQCPGPEIELIF